MTATPRGRRLLVTVVLALGAGCAAPQQPPPPQPSAPPEPCKEPERVALLVDAAPNLNPGPDGQPLPTVVWLYQLKATQRLELMSLDDVIRDKNALADDLLEAREVTLAPSARITPEMFRKPGATHVAAVAFFRRPTGPSWRAVAPLPASDPFHCYRRERTRWIQFFLQAYQAIYVP